MYNCIRVGYVYMQIYTSGMGYAMRQAKPRLVNGFSLVPNPDLPHSLKLGVMGVMCVHIPDTFQMSKNKNCFELPFTNGMRLYRAPVEFQNF